MTKQDATQELARRGYTVRLARREWKRLSQELRDLVRIVEAD